jgi:hypothetical protein
VTKDLVEFLYVDVPRLQSYYEQLEIKPRRVPVFSANLSLSGPVIGSTWSKETTVKLHSMLDAVRDYLVRSGMLAFHRPAGQERWNLGRQPHELAEGNRPEAGAIFREETLELRTAVLQTSTVPLDQPLTLWINGLLFEQLLLIQQFPLDDEPFAYTVSGYSLLSMESDLFALPKVPGIGVNVYNALEQVGARVGPGKMCRVLYRVRATFAEPQRGFAITTIGYPLAIVRA